VSVMRYTVVDAEGTTSFVGPCHYMKMLAAACSRGATDHRRLLAVAEEFDPRQTRAILDGLARFDQHRAAAGPDLSPADGADDPPIRVVDDATRRRSLAPVRAGLVVFNLPAKRIVQIQNSYADLRRQDRGRLRRDGRPVRAYYSYELPPDWTIVP